MCFSAEVSFVAGAALIGAGGYATRRAAVAAPALLAVAAYPLGFGVQQLVEGALWLQLSSPEPALAHAGRLALAFLFFSHLLWPVWAPLSIYWLMRGSGREPVLRLLTGLGAVCGVLLFGPLLRAGAVPVHAEQGHISYDTASVYDGSTAPIVVLALYGLVVLGPFLLSGRRSIQAFGGVLLLSMLLAYAFYAATYISVWCFFAAVISGYAALMVARRTRVTSPREVR